MDHPSSGQKVSWKIWLIMSWPLVCRSAWNDVIYEIIYRLTWGHIGDKLNVSTGKCLKIAVYTVDETWPTSLNQNYIYANRQTHMNTDWLFWRYEKRESVNYLSLTKILQFCPIGPKSISRRIFSEWKQKKSEKHYLRSATMYAAKIRPRPLFSPSRRGDLFHPTRPKGLTYGDKFLGHMNGKNP